jgi:hypothetical protein
MRLPSPAIFRVVGGTLLATTGFSLGRLSEAFDGGIASWISAAVGGFGILAGAILIAWPDRFWAAKRGVPA